MNKLSFNLKGSATKERGAAISLSEMMIAVVVSAILVGAVVATLVSVIPWFQNEQAKSNLMQVKKSQEAFHIIYGRYASLPDLVAYEGNQSGRYLKPASHGWDWEPATQGEPNSVYALRLVHEAEAKLFRAGNIAKTGEVAYEWHVLKALGELSTSSNDWADGLAVVTSGWKEIQGLPEYVAVNGCTGLDPADWLTGTKYFAFSLGGDGTAYYLTESMNTPQNIEELSWAERDQLSAIYALKNGGSLPVDSGFMNPSPCS